RFCGCPACVAARPICRGPEPQRCASMLPGTANLSRQTGGRELARVVFDEQTIARRVAELGREITAAYPEGELLVLGLLKGSFIFLSDLVLEPRFVGFDAPRSFLVGYGLDHAENFRHLPYIASLS